MKAITISTENRETHSSISNFFIDYYMTDANGEFVKVYLYLVRLLSNNSAVTIAQIADHFNLTEKDICRAIKFWISKDVLKLSYDGKGKLNGIILLPLKEPDDLLNSDEHSFEHLLNSNEENNEVESDSQNVATIVKMPLQPSAELVVPAKQKFSEKAVKALSGDEDWEDITYQVETLFGKPLSSRELNSLMYIYNDLEFDVDLFEYLIQYCIMLEKKSCNYMEAVAISWYKDGIKTSQQAKEQCSLTNGIVKLVHKALCINRRNPSPAELEYVKTWNKDFGFEANMIQCACEKAILEKPNSANFPYVDGILKKWNEADIRTLSDVEKSDKAFAARNSAKANTQLKKNSFNNFNQTKSDDLDEMKKLFIKEVNS